LLFTESDVSIVVTRSTLTISRFSNPNDS
jgi:hypothetical protein